MLVLDQNVGSGRIHGLPKMTDLFLSLISRIAFSQVSRVAALPM